MVLSFFLLPLCCCFYRPVLKTIISVLTFKIKGMSKIFVLANQKGGVGKSTLAILIANHLAANDKSVGVIELDVQRSLTNKRKTDRESFGDDELNYPIEYLEPKDPMEATNLINKLRSLDDDNIFLFDLPGKIDDDVLVPFLISADYILCPFQYEAMCLESTTTFILVMKELIKRFNAEPKIIFCPNNVDKRIGTKAELDGWQKVDERMAAFGTVVPRIPAAADLRRMNTFSNTPRQEEIAERFLKTFDELI